MHLIYGIHPVLELLRHDFRKIERLWITENTDSPRLKELVSQARRLGIPVHYEPKAAIRRRAGSEQHQGVVAAVTAARLLEDDEVLDQGGDEALLLVLDGILDPQNLGAILRTADAAGVSGIFLAERRTAPLTPAAIKASAGAAHHLRIARIGNVAYFIGKLKGRNFRIVGLDAGAGKEWCNADLTGPVALVLGSEGEGLRRIVKQSCDECVCLPMLGRIGSLNVSAAAAAVLFECVRQRRR